MLLMESLYVRYVLLLFLKTKPDKRFKCYTSRYIKDAYDLFMNLKRKNIRTYVRKITGNT